MSDAGPAARDRLLTIGAFARRSRLSVKALRLYDRSGLLRPAHVDPATGYRRYRESQLLRARLIVMMRRVGIPLAQVAEIISAPGPAGADLLAAYWADVESRFEVQRELVSRLRTSLVSGTTIGAGHEYDVRERDVPGQLVLAEKRALRITELKKWLPDVLCRLAETARRHGGLDGDLFVIFHGEVNEDSDGPVEACAPVPSSAVLPPDMVVRHEAAHREAYVTITRAQLEFPQILSAYDAVADWIGTAGLAVAGPPREVYPRGTDVAAAAPGDPVCQIAYPICLAGGQVLATSVSTSYVATGLPLALTTSASQRTSP
ncbi:MAG TPA: MerR family transcriptional regulator [Streptosporangiaceae bacterium]